MPDFYIRQLQLFLLTAPHAGLFLLLLSYWLTRKRVYILLHIHFVCHYIFCYLVFYILLYFLCVFPTVSTKYPLHQKCLFPYLYFKFACLSNIISELFPLRYPTICDTLYLGGIFTSICTWSMQHSASIISISFLSQSILNILPISRLKAPYISLLLYFGYKYYMKFAIPRCAC